MTARDELSNTLLRKGEQHSIESLVGSGPYFRSDSGAVQQQGTNDPASPRAQSNVHFQELLDAQALPLVESQGINEHMHNASASNLTPVDSTDQHLPLAQRQLSEIPQSPHLTASPSRPVTPPASMQEPDSGETGAQDAKFGVARSGDRSTLHEESHPQDALIDNSTPDDEEEHSSLSNRSYAAILTSLSGESPKSQPTRTQDQIPIITNRPTPVSMPTTPIKKSLSGPGPQRVCLNGRAEFPSYAGPDASVANFSECFELDPCPLSPGEVRSPIRGTVRKRQAMDDFPGNMRKRYRGQWEDLCAKDRDERGTIDGYESGDSELEFSEWEDAKERRKKKRKL